MNLKLAEIGCLDSKAGDVPALAVFGIPIPRDLASILFEQNRIEDRLPVQTRGKGAKVALTDLGKLVVPSGTIQDGRLRLLNPFAHARTPLRTTPYHAHEASWTELGSGF